MNKRKTQEPEQTTKHMPNIKCFVLVISRYHNSGEIETDRQQYYNKEDAETDIKKLIIDLLEVVVYTLKLYKKEERERCGVDLNFDDIFIYDLRNRTLKLKNSKYPSSELINFLIPEILGYNLKYKIWEVLTNYKEDKPRYKRLTPEPLTAKDAENIEGGHPLYRQ